MDDDFGQNVEGSIKASDDEDMDGSVQQRAAEAELEMGWEPHRSEPPSGALFYQKLNILLIWSL
jgi:hypothetical protein